MTAVKNHRLVWVAPLATVAILFGSVGVASATGAWVTSGRQVITATTTLTADDLKGWMTFQQAADGLGMDVQKLIALTGAPAGVLTPATAFKDVEALVPGFELSSFRETVRAALGGTPATAAPGPTASGSATPGAGPTSP